jgi:hypothetical protein
MRLQQQHIIEITLATYMTCKIRLLMLESKAFKIFALKDTTYMKKGYKYLKQNDKQNNVDQCQI